jgi:hypothetical protein
MSNTMIKRLVSPCIYVPLLSITSRLQSIGYRLRIIVSMLGSQDTIYSWDGQIALSQAISCRSLNRQAWTTRTLQIVLGL